MLADRASISPSKSSGLSSCKESLFEGFSFPLIGAAPSGLADNGAVVPAFFVTSLDMEWVLGQRDELPS